MHASYRAAFVDSDDFRDNIKRDDGAGGVPRADRVGPREQFRGLIMFHMPRFMVSFREEFLRASAS
jgi:hypothetical protein